MGILTKIVLSPVRAPLSGTFWIAEKIHEAAEAQRNDKSTLKAALQDAEARLLSGALSEEEYDILETDLLLRLKNAK